MQIIKTLEDADPTEHLNNSSIKNQTSILILNKDLDNDKTGDFSPSFKEETKKMKECNIIIKKNGIRNNNSKTV